jgi:Protein of unknown function (DUF742)
MSRRTSTRRERLGIGLPTAPSTPVENTHGDAVARPFLGRLASDALADLPTEVDGDVVRSFVITGGRSVSDTEWLNFETMLEATPLMKAYRAVLRFEPAQIADLCIREVVSVAEAAARLCLPLGVVQVLAGDLLEEGLLEAHRPHDEFSNDVTLIRRLIDGIRAL